MFWCTKTNALINRNCMYIMEFLNPCRQQFDAQAVEMAKKDIWHNDGS